MKILFINGSDTKGGAAIAATRLRKELASIPETYCSAVVANKHSSDPSVKSSRSEYQRIIENVIDRVSAKMGMQYQFFPFSTASILKYIDVYKPDVVSLHNTHGGYFETSLIERISAKVPIVWTLHDMWSFTGNSAHTFGNEDWKKLEHGQQLITLPPEIGINTGPWLLRQKKRIYSRSRFTIVTPSHWLQKLAKQSPVFEGKTIYRIANGINLEVYNSAARESARRRLSILPDDKVIVFSADFLQGNVWKGGDDLVQVLKYINSKATSNVHLIIIGDGELKDLSLLTNLRAHTVGYVKEEKVMAEYLAASDVLVYPTRADNLPNVLIESIACGTPCVTFDVGGCAEIVIDGENGRVVKPGDFEGMALGVLELINNPVLNNRFSANGRRHAENSFSVTTMAQEYKKLFAEVVRVHLKSNP